MQFICGTITYPGCICASDKTADNYTPIYPRARGPGDIVMCNICICCNICILDSTPVNRLQLGPTILDLTTSWTHIPVGLFRVDSTPVWIWKTVAGSSSPVRPNGRIVKSFRHSDESTPMLGHRQALNRPPAWTLDGLTGRLCAWLALHSCHPMWPLGHNLITGCSMVLTRFFIKGNLAI